MFATGTFLACTLGCKMVGLLTFAAVGIAVLFDLWELLDIRNGLTIVGYLTFPSKLILTRRLPGTILSPLPRSGSWTHRLAVHHILVVLLGPLQSLEVLWQRRLIHEPCLPRELDWQ